jgi:hypothetical protein
VHRAGHGQGDDGGPGQRPAAMAGPDEQSQQRPHDQVGDDPPVAAGDAEAGNRRDLPRQGDDEPGGSLHCDPSSGSSGGAPVGGASGGGTPGGVEPGG